MSTGWFGIPGKVPPANVKVHVFQDDIGKTLCGWTPSREHQFQWCAHGINLPMIDCSKCRATAKKFLAIIATADTSGKLLYE